ncbi:4Fe-4S binding domain protein [Bacteriovorax sp. BSW11_IV]|uniref:4Fe-4S binding protein n=1 Tax=Bacteriovorax sp. BSW11_IV TaxID=1353529 RepID=UPI00038A2B4B|nr:4Fe-4S binding protein [Bacteriovorax sp. BSW11_IV]EQC50323.1 4Fe-4S binding domain protein [Bacteriovorax sp. BSW11_IV]
MSTHNETTILTSNRIHEPLTLGKWFKNVWTAVSTVTKGMAITFRYVYGVKPVTIEYPEVREELPANSRSRLFNDVENCISCYQCATACPVDCIYITATRRDKEAPAIKTKDGTPIRLDLKQYTIDTALCCYCGLCTTVCPTECLTHTTDYEFAQYTLSSMKYDYLADDIKVWRDRIVKD